MQRLGERERGSIHELQLELASSVFSLFLKLHELHLVFMADKRPTHEKERFKYGAIMHFPEDAEPMDVKDMEVRTGELDLVAYSSDGYGCEPAVCFAISIVCIRGHLGLQNKTKWHRA